MLRVEAGRRPVQAGPRCRSHARRRSCRDARLQHRRTGAGPAALAAEKPDVALRWIRSIYLDTTRPTFAAGVLLCVARLPGVGNAGWRARLVRGALAADDVEVRDAAKQAAEHWGDPGLRRTLSAHSEPVGWLDEYRRGVMEDLGR